MERRYYLRGLGVGIAVTAVIMGVMTSRSGKMTDREVIARAKELGMVENTVLLDGNDEVPGEEEEADTDNEVQDGAGAAEENLTGSGTETGAGKEAGVNKTNENTDVTGNALEDDPEGNADDGAESDGTGDVGAADKASSNLPEEDADERTQESAETDESERESGRTTEEETKALITSAAVKQITVNSGDGSHTVAQKLADAGVIISADSFDDYLCRYGYDKKLRTGTFSIPADASDEQIARIVTGAE